MINKVEYEHGHEIFPNPEKSESGRLREWLGTHGIKAVIFDLDDTLLDTYTWERMHEYQYLDYVQKLLPHIPKEQLNDSFREAHNQAYHLDSVHRKRWDTIIRLLTNKYGEQAGKEFAFAKPLLMHIYEDSPALLPGALHTLDTFRSAVDKLGLVTHAEKAYTYQKLNDRDLRKYFDLIQIADPHGRKTAKDWKLAIDGLGVKPEEVLVVGDNVIGDIRAAMETGVRYTVALPSKWEVYAKGDIPKDTIRAEVITDVIPMLLATH